MYSRYKWYNVNTLRAKKKNKEQIGKNDKKRSKTSTTGTHTTVKEDVKKKRKCKNN